LVDGSASDAREESVAVGVLTPAGLSFELDDSTGDALGCEQPATTKPMARTDAHEMNNLPLRILGSCKKGSV
jgi:hypothetical protein